MSDNIINKKEQKKPEEICSSEKSTLQKKRKNNIKSSGLNSNITEPDYNLLYFEINDIDPREYFSQKSRVDQINQKSPEKNEEINNLKNVTILINNCSDNTDNNSYFSLESPEPKTKKLKTKEKK